MARRKIKGLSLDKGQLVKAVGYAMSKGGNLAARRWYLGTDPTAALAMVEKIKAAWAQGNNVNEIDHDGRKVRVWSEHADPLAQCHGVAAMPTGAAPAPALVPNVNGMTIADAATMYLANIERRFKAGQVSHAYWVSESFNLSRGLDLLGRDRPLASVGSSDLTAAVLALAARPQAKAGKGRKTPTERISVKSAKSYLASLRAFLDEMSKTETHPGSDVSVWRKPLRFDDIFRDNQPQLTSDEKHQLLSGNGGEADAFTIDEIRMLYSAASDRQRLWLLLALNCGFASMELATLSTQELIGLDTDAPTIKRFRNKSDIYGEWSLWKTTAEYLRFFMLKDAKLRGDRQQVLLTDDGRTLIEPRGMGRRDAVRSSWVNIVKALPPDRRLPFKVLRKTGARLIRHSAMGGDAVAEMYLSHADDKSGILNAYSGRDWSKLALATNELHRMIFDGWTPKIRKVTRGRGKGKYVELRREDHRPMPVGV
jgi:hypothetical protein